MDFATNPAMVARGAREKMSLSIAQKSKSVRTGWWTWEVWIEGPALEFAKVKAVNYILHPTFAHPVQRRTNPHDKFRLKSEGWGEFLIKAQLELLDGHRQELSVWLSLEGTAPAKKAPVRIFFSYSAADTPAANDLRARLQSRSVNVLDSSSDPDFGDSWADANSALIKNSDVVLALTSDTMSSWVERDISTAKRFSVPVIKMSPKDSTGNTDKILLALSSLGKLS